MTVSTSTNTSTYTGNGVTTAFSFPYLFYDESHLVVTVDGVTKTLTTHYTVTGEANPAGGTVTFLTAPANATAIIIQRIVPYTQGTDLENFDGNPADVTEKQFDLLAMADQQLAEQTERAIRFPIGAVIDSNEILGTIDSTTRYLAITDEGIITATAVSPGDLTVSSFIETLLDDPSASAARDTLGLGSTDDVAFDALTLTGKATMGAATDFAKGADIASAATTDIWAATGNSPTITGTATITSFGTASQTGIQRLIRFSGAATITNNASIVVQGGANIVTAAGDYALVTARTTTIADVVFFKANGRPVTDANGLVYLGIQTASSSATLDFTSLITSTYDEYVFEIQDLKPATDNVNLWIRTSTNNSSFDTGASDYKYAGDASGNSSAVNKLFSNGAAQIVAFSGTGNAATESLSGKVTLINPLGTTNTKKVLYQITGDLNNDEFSVVQGAGKRDAAADVDAIRFMFSSGNIASGVIRMYGVVKS